MLGYLSHFGLKPLPISIGKRTPQEVWLGEPTDFSNLRNFGCLAYAYVHNGKLEPRFVKCVFLGYKDGVKSYKLWCPETKKVIISRDVLFDGTAMLHATPTIGFGDVD